MILQHLQSHPNWQPTTKLYYGKYHTKIKIKQEIDYFSRRSELLDIPVKFDKKYKIAHRFDWNTYFDSKDDTNNNTDRKYINMASVYTSDNDLVNYLINKYDNVVEIQSPSNQKHLECISDTNRTFIYRPHLWYKKYAHKTEIRLIREMRYSLDQESIDSATHQIYSLFDPATSHWPAKHASYYNLFRSRWNSVAVYTNDEPAIMLLKMVTGDVFDVAIKTAITEETV